MNTKDLDRKYAKLIINKCFVNVAKKPLVIRYNYKDIESFALRFKNGEVKDIITKNKEDYEILKTLIMNNTNSKYLGEVALVENDTPVGKTNSLYLEPLYDENSSCHLALGNTFPDTIENGLSMSLNELKNNGLNVSNIHIDFMIGTPDLTIEANTNKGKELIFTNGKFKV